MDEPRLLELVREKGWAGGNGVGCDCEWVALGGSLGGGGRNGVGGLSGGMRVGEGGGGSMFAFPRGKPPLPRIKQITLFDFAVCTSADRNIFCRCMVQAASTTFQSHLSSTGS